ncbi:MAG: hypothetical protein ACLP36_01920 [Acidimicrobiales bacterium]
MIVALSQFVVARRLGEDGASSWVGPLPKYDEFGSSGEWFPKSLCMASERPSTVKRLS